MLLITVKTTSQLISMIDILTIAKPKVMSLPVSILDLLKVHSILKTVE